MQIARAAGEVSIASTRKFSFCYELAGSCKAQWPSILQRVFNLKHCARKCEEILILPWAGKHCIEKYELPQD